MTAPVLFEATADEFRRIVERAAVDPDRAPVRFEATVEELRRILAKGAS